MSYAKPLFGFMFGCVVTTALLQLGTNAGAKKVLGATAEVRVGSPGVAFLARVDTGASLTSLDVDPEGVVIEDESEAMEDNIGKAVRVKVRNRQGDEVWTDTSIDAVVNIRSAHGVAPRYQVSLPVECQGIKRTLRATLNQRPGMRHALLLGRDFLSPDFVVDVARDDTNPL